jgi:hypothetical protein
MINEYKQNLIELLNTLESDDAMITTLIKFIETYSGDNQEELTELVIHTVGHMYQFEQNLAQADGYQIAELNDGQFNKELAVIKNEFEQVEQGKIIQPPLIDSE